jgi:hypothetical protein
MAFAVAGSRAPRQLLGRSTALLVPVEGELCPWVGGWYCSVQLLRGSRASALREKPYVAAALVAEPVKS